MRTCKEGKKQYQTHILLQKKKEDPLSTTFYHPLILNSHNPPEWALRGWQLLFSQTFSRRKEKFPIRRCQCAVSLVFVMSQKKKLVCKPVNLNLYTQKLSVKISLSILQGKDLQRRVSLKSKPRAHVTLTPFSELMTLIYGLFPALSLSNVLYRDLYRQAHCPKGKLALGIHS